MLFRVEMEVVVPNDIDTEHFEALKKTEKNYAQDLQEKGIWRHLWRIVGHYRNISIFDVESNQELHDILMGLPLYSYMNIDVVALCRHPSSVHEDDR